MATLVSRAAIWALVFAPLALAGMATGVRAAESAYTKLDFDACETLSSSEEGGSVSLRCVGYGDAPIFYNEGDLRADVDFGAPNDEFATFGGFNTVGTTVEWRLEGGRPAAAIIRYLVQSADGGAEGQVLSIHKVGEGETPGCVVAYVDARANRNANDMARQAADARVPGFACGRDRPAYIGDVSPSGQGATAVDD